MGSCELPNLGPLEKQHVLLTVESSLQPVNSFNCSKKIGYICFLKNPYSKNTTFERNIIKNINKIQLLIL